MVDYGNYRWLQYNTIIDNTELDLKEKGLLLVMFRYVNYEKGYADPSRTLIKKLTGIKKDETLDKIFNSLIDKGVLIRESGKGGRSKYFIKVGGEITTNTKVVPSEEVIPVEEKKQKIEKNNNAHNEFFEECWSLYPRKIGKGKISATKKKALYKLNDEFKRCIERYIKECKNTEERYIQHGSTFFNSGYVDFLDKNYSENKCNNQNTSVRKVADF
ncbi:hypothetical protein [Clostridium sp. UBA7339]|uniref:hypothetical protein n=1 Tax=Clostridium sp. UBA7339 TaxID=1946376 RepID=UPI003217B46A